jgi:hypothetical protein
MNSSTNQNQASHRDLRNDGTIMKRSALTKRNPIAKPSMLSLSYILDLFGPPALVGSENRARFCEVLAGYVIEFEPRTMTEGAKTKAGFFASFQTIRSETMLTKGCGLTLQLRRIPIAIGSLIN